MSGERVLVVDDNPLNLKLACLVLRTEGYEVEVAADAEEVLEMLERVRPRLILMDLQLPGMNGLELTKLLKANPETRSIRILAFTSYAMKGDEERARAAGCDGYITKPIDTRALPKTIREHLACDPA